MVFIPFPIPLHSHTFGDRDGNSPKGWLFWKLVFMVIFQKTLKSNKQGETQYHRKFCKYILAVFGDIGTFGDMRRFYFTILATLTIYRTSEMSHLPVIKL